MRIGVLLPTFEVGADAAFEFARRADDAGLDGVFAYDHLWPMGSPTRPSLAPFAVLAAIVARHEQLVVGPLVARVGLTGTSHLVEQFLTLEALAPRRVLAALGTGDKLSAPENLAYDVVPRGADERRALMEATAIALGPVMPVWFGGGAAATNELARRLGVTINLWNATPDRVRELSATGPVSWAGPVPHDLSATLDALCDAGATWAVLSPQVDVEQLGEWRRTQPETRFH